MTLFSVYQTTFKSSFVDKYSNKYLGFPEYTLAEFELITIVLFLGTIFFKGRNINPKIFFIKDFTIASYPCF
jgi:hypothetical protein